ncbi:hypothetical protein K457DRAFT_316993 [Linnemannia elongata AG-77]|uniref:Uncharacterized protein n=1 Tax=Linnemannia elongata AG-77 TaxID=1314771 RepID=A0A197K3J9_9FUNG|nr:hypothetical protein K457DRAFT_316993 [Linnemannia elongata AG-77]
MMMSKNNIAYSHLNHHFAAAASTIVSPLPSPAMSLHDTINPWANISPSSHVPAPSHHNTTPATTPVSTSSSATEQLSTPAVVYSNSTQPIISFDGNIQPKNVINDVFLSSTMLYDDVELYLNDSSASSFDSDSDSGFSTPSQNDDDHPSCFSTPMTPMSPFMENDTEDHPLYPTEEEDVQESSSRKESKDTKPVDDGNRALLFLPCFCVFFPTVVRFQLYPVIQTQFCSQFSSIFINHSAAHYFSSGSEGCKRMYLCVFYACVWFVFVFVSFFPAVVLIMFLLDQLASD